MQDRPTSTIASSWCDQFAGHFRVLGIDPTATVEQIERAYAIARQQGVAPEQKLTEARNVILDPAQRLLCELAYPFDCSAEQSATFYDGLSRSASVSVAMGFVERLPTLAQANYLAHLAAKTPADADLMFALVGAHAAVDAATIFETLSSIETARAFRCHPC